MTEPNCAAYVGPRIGSLCSGYGGLEMGLMAVVGGSVAWHAELDKHPAAILDARWPGVPNYGDITATDWTTVEPVDWLTAGYPCQPFSHAGKRKGSADERHLWPFVAGAIGALRPRRVLLENVAGHVTLGLDAVLGDLAALGYDATWGVVRAADAGAPHGRARLFIVASDAASGSVSDGQVCGGTAGQHVGPVVGAVCRDRPRRTASRVRELAGTAAVVATPADAHHTDWRGRDAEWRQSGRDVAAGGRESRSGRPVTADTASDGRHEGRAEPARLVGRSDAAECRPASADADRDGLEGVRWVQSLGRDTDGRRGQDVAWGQYESAIRRWERVTGRPAPRPTDARRVAVRSCELCGCPDWFHHYAPCLGQWWKWVHRLSPRFVEWLMGLPAGWVTDVGLPRNAQLKALGNGVVPQQAALALRTLLALEAVAA